MKEDHNRFEKLKEEALKLPENPGVYLFYNNKENIIYIGKAKRLKQRVSSYFNKGAVQGKALILVRQIVRIEHIVVETETDALLLENNLIKKYQPRYNVLLKDDKTYPWICIKQEAFPRVFQTRTLIKDGSKYYGPYTAGKQVKVILGLFRQLFHIRTCHYDLREEMIQKGNYHV
jgi:excinuclease ABC subunit C